MLVRLFSWPAGLLCGLTVSAILLAGCTSSHYRKSADKETYKIIQQIDNQVFGRTNAFTIETPYSQRDPKTILPAEIIEDRTATNRRIINLEQALTLAVQHSREYQSQKELLYLTALNLTGVRYEFSPQFFANSTAQITGTPDTGLEALEVKSKVGVNQLLKTGGSLGVALANDILTYYTGNQPRSVINVISVDLAQPLLRGFGKNNPAVENLTQAERNVVYAVRSYNLYQQQFAVDTVAAYFSLLTQKDIVRNNFRNYTNRVETTKYLEARAVDRERKNSVDDARTAELGARRDYINSLAAYLSSVDIFKLRLGLPLSEQLYLDDKDLKELIQTGLVPVEIDPKVAFQLCLERQMDVLNAIDKFEDSKRKVRVAADLLRADLNLFASGSLQSEGIDDYTNFDPNKFRYSAGIRLDLPIDRLRERNTYRTFLVSFEAQLRSLGLTLDTYKNRIDQGLRNIERERLNYLNGVESLKVAERRVDNNAMLLEAGRATIRDLREAQDSLIDAQNTLSSLYTSYLAARLSFLVNIGVIDMTPQKFWLLDPLKDRLTPEQRSAPPLRMPDDQVVPPESFLEPTS